MGISLWKNPVRVSGPERGEDLWGRRQRKKQQNDRGVQ